MPARHEYVFEGLFEASLLGTFRVIRGFASLKELAEVSVAYEMAGEGDDERVRGQQRRLDEDHADRIRKYLERGDRRFLPEVILSIRSEFVEELGPTGTPVGIRSTQPEIGISIARKTRSGSGAVHRVRVRKKLLEQIRAAKLIRRIDGNHRLAYASQLADDPSLATKYRAAFCLVLLGGTGNVADDYSESLIFHTINSTALPLESEHALRLILGQGAGYDMLPEQEFAYSPSLYFTRLLRDGVVTYPAPVRSRLGERPLTGLERAAKGLIDIDGELQKDKDKMEECARVFLRALPDIVTLIDAARPELCKAGFFVELVARVWKSLEEGTSHQRRVRDAVAWLDGLSRWLGKDGWVGLKETGSLSKQILDIYRSIRARVPSRIFLARWYPAANTPDGSRAALRLAQIKETIRQVKDEIGNELELIDMGTRTGSTFPIHARMYEAIASADIIVIDLTGVRPNVCLEAGYALRNHEKGRLVFLFQPVGRAREVPFDLNTFRYESFRDTGELPGKLKPHLVEILRSARVGE